MGSGIQNKRSTLEDLSSVISEWWPQARCSALSASSKGLCPGHLGLGGERTASLPMASFCPVAPSLCSS